MSKRLFPSKEQSFWHFRIFLWLFCFFNIISLSVYLLFRFGFTDLHFGLPEEIGNIGKVMGVASTFAFIITLFILLADALEYWIKKKRNESLS